MEYPILMSGPMVRAILAGTKTQTRRLPTRQHCAYIPAWFWKRLEFDPAKVAEGAPPIFADDGYLHVPCRPHPEDSQDGEYWTRERVYPKWSVGDRLWIRETWTSTTDCDGQILMDGRKALYRATDPEYWVRKWRPSIFMPRWASRVTLEITRIGCERLQDISEEDCVAEGIDDAWLVAHHSGPPRRREYQCLWDSLNGKKCPWKSNPWVWVIGFSRLARSEKENP